YVLRPVGRSSRRRAQCTVCLFSGRDRSRPADCAPRPLTATTAEREENTTFPHVLVSNRTATLRITDRAPRQLPLRALSTNEKHLVAVATRPAYCRVSSPLPSART